MNVARPPARERDDLPEGQSGLAAEPNTWRLVETPATNGSRNMAVDVALAESVREGGPPVLRFYRWWPPCISLGRNQPARGHYDETEAARRGIEFVRRPTGGRAVYHHHEVTYSVCVGDRQLGGPRRTYDAIHKGLYAGLRLLGADIDIVSDIGSRMRPSTIPCFQDVDGGAIVSGRKKLLGSAQLREGGVLLQHGSLLLSGDQSPTIELLRVRGKSLLSEQTAALDELVKNLPTWAELIDSLANGLERLLGLHLVESVLTEQEHARADAYSRRFSDPDWTWRL
ncbi:MAG: lipoate--protein ligase family protein [Gemmatimonadota bacterium]|nr:MAG: lipoate--protein ligase family protein [Gemmatimonadota bacterium]